MGLTDFEDTKNHVKKGGFICCGKIEIFFNFFFDTGTYWLFSDSRRCSISGGFPMVRCPLSCAAEATLSRLSIRARLSIGGVVAALVPYERGLSLNNNEKHNPQKRT